eukprot:6149618-Amphidinium_carterae.1
MKNGSEYKHSEPLFMCVTFTECNTDVWIRLSACMFYTHKPRARYDSYHFQTLACALDFVICSSTGGSYGCWATTWSDAGFPAEVQL